MIAHGHLVHFYDDDNELASSVVRFLEPALLRNEGAVVIATQPHIEAFKAGLEQRGLDVNEFVAREQLVLLDASETLSHFMNGSLPDPEKFEKVIGDIIDKTRNKFSAVSAFG